MKILIIRFSSIGDLTQSLSLPSFIKSYVPDAEVHFVTRQDLSELVAHHPQVHQLWTLDRKEGFGGLCKLILALRKENFTHIYDAHNNLRSFFIRSFVSASYKLTRPMMRWKRFLLLNFKINKFEMPFSGQRDLIKPLEKWGFSFKLPPTPQLFLSDKINIGIGLPSRYVVLAPSAAYELKRWPLDYWSNLVKINADLQFVVLAGAEDTFTEKLNQHQNVINLTGKTDLMQSALVLKNSALAICNDTGLLHFAEQLGKPAIALMGPAPFGFPCREKTKILERNLSCRPCSKHGQGPCTNKDYHACLRNISVDEVNQHLHKMMKAL